MNTSVGTVFTEGGMKSHRAYRLCEEGREDFIYTDCRVGRHHKLVKFEEKGYRRITCLTATCQGSTGNEESVL